MSKHVLFVCKSCNAKSDLDQTTDPSDGTKLLNQLQTQHQTGVHQSDIEIRPVGCLWICSQPCAVAFSAPSKPTYLFTKVPGTAATDLLTFGDLYSDSKNGDIPWKQFPEVLQSAEVAKIPSVS